MDDDVPRRALPGAPPVAPPVAEPFRGPAADSWLGERLLDVIGIVAREGFAAEVSHALWLCGETFRPSATNDAIAGALQRQCGARAARAAPREASAAIGARSTQLMRAAFGGDARRVRQLVQLGAPLGLVDAVGKTALHWACERGQLAAAEALLNGKFSWRRAACDAPGQGGRTPLMEAAFAGHTNVARLLVSRGAGIARVSLVGYTAMHYAVVAGRAAVLELLAHSFGSAAALSVRDQASHTPRALAAARGQAACEAVLRARGAPL